MKFLCLIIIMTWTHFLSADEFSYPERQLHYSDFGSVGLMQTPTARMNDEGMFGMSYVLNDDYKFLSASVQLLPWFESTIRYSILNDVLYSPFVGFSGDNDYADKGLDFKFRLLEESKYFPQLAIGMRDLGGTGLFGGEYIVASKAYNSFDFTIGIGFGYLGQSANLRGDQASGGDCGRESGASGSGGQFDYSRWFTGCVAVFGGVSYQTAWSPLTLNLEYDGNDYSREPSEVRSDVVIDQSSPWNIGATYRISDWGHLNLSYQRGNTVSLGFSFITDFGNNNRSWNDDRVPSYKHGKSEQKNWPKLASDLQESAGYQIDKIRSNDDVLIVYGAQKKYRDINKANERAATLLSNANSTAKSYKIVTVSNHVESVETEIPADDFNSFATVASPGLELKEIEKRSYVKDNSDAPIVWSRDKKLSYGLSPVLGQSFGGPEDFYLYNIGIAGNAKYWLSDHLYVSAGAYLNLYDNFDKFNFLGPPQDGETLPRVRSLIRQYVDANTVDLSNLQLTWLDSISDNQFVSVYGGYLESMFGGVGAEYLYRKVGSTWAIGADINYVKQRDPDSQLGFFDESDQGSYIVQTGIYTGHLSLYLKPEIEMIKNIGVTLSVGQYLAGDRGITAAFTKVFDSGVAIGAYATKTNLSSEEFGEGSFSKGFYISIPFDLMSTKHTSKRAMFAWTPLTRDGGQKLARAPSLIGVVGSRTNYRWNVNDGSQ